MMENKKGKEIGEEKSGKERWPPGIPEISNSTLLLPFPQFNKYIFSSLKGLCKQWMGPVSASLCDEVKMRKSNIMENLGEK